jgi:hypothetical protein
VVRAPEAAPRAAVLAPATPTPRPTATPDPYLLHLFDGGLLTPADASINDNIRYQLPRGSIARVLTRDHSFVIYQGATVVSVAQGCAEYQQKSKYDVRTWLMLCATNGMQGWLEPNY